MKFQINSSEMNIDLNQNKLFRYLVWRNRHLMFPKIEGFSNQKQVNRDKWKASNLFGIVNQHSAKLCWKYEGILTGIGKSANLTVTVPSNCDEGSVFACMIVDGKIIAAEDRAPSFPYNNWEHYSVANKNLTFLYPG